MIIPAILTTNPRIAQERITQAQQMGSMVHIDVLDNTLYKFNSLSAEELGSLDFAGLEVEVHAMIDDPAKIIDSMMPIARVIVHYELPRHENHYTDLVNNGMDIWLAISPETDLNEVDLPNDISGIVLMGVTPGQSGQELDSDVYNRLDILKDRYSDIPITVDGGVKEENLRELIAHGADNVVMGSGLFEQPDPVATYHRLAKLADPLGGLSDDQEPRA